MGTHNRQRRAAKKKRARVRLGQPSPHRQAPARPPRDRQPSSSDTDLRLATREMLERAAVAGLQRHAHERAVTLEALAFANTDLVLSEAEAMLARFVPRMWESGWQPAELVRQVRREASPASVAVVAAAIAADHASRPPESIDPRWQAQIESLDLPTVDPRPGWLELLAFAEHLGIGECIDATVGVVSAILATSPLQALIPPPGSSAASAAPPPRRLARDRVADPVLTKVRALLAQAESTNFPAEAETFTAKAQELMARHAIDEALVWDQSPESSGVTTIRLPIDDPYSAPKGTLLAVVARAFRCKTITHTAYGMTSVVGFGSDLMSVEVMFTSLLVQAQMALQAEAASSPPGSRTRSRGFRSSFLTGYAYRIGERLRQVTADVQDEMEADRAAGGATSILPVLASRSALLDTEIARLFPNAVTKRTSASVDGVGLARGRAAADKASLVTRAIAG